MDERMTQAAESGDINALHQLIGEDVNLLDHIDQVSNSFRHSCICWAHPICQGDDGIEALICLETKSKLV